MTIGRIGPLEQVYGGSGKVNSASKPVKGDSVSISKEALAKADHLHSLEIVDAAPNERAERIAELKTKINDPSYINETIIQQTAEKIIDVLFPGAESPAML